MTRKLNHQDHPAGTRPKAPHDFEFGKSPRCVKCGAEWDEADCSPCEPKPTPSVAQMCRDLLTKAVDDDIILLSDESPFPSDLAASDIVGMASMLAEFMAQENAKLARRAEEATKKVEPADGEQMCRDLLEQAIADELVLARGHGGPPGEPRKFNDGNFTGMANMLTEFIGQQVTACVVAKQELLAKLDKQIGSGEGERRQEGGV